MKDKGYQLSVKFRIILNGYHINTPLRLAHFFAQIHTESNLEPKTEGMYYTTVDRARAVFRTPFFKKSDAFVEKHLRNPEKIGNYVYANRMGNGNEASKDGYKYRGRGYLMNTGFWQYLRLSKNMGVDFLENPELLETEVYAMLAACEYWKENRLNRFADADNLDAVSDIVNIGRTTRTYGDSNDFEKRLHWLNHYKKVFKA